MLRMNCAILTIYIRDREEENKKLSDFFNFLKKIFNQDKAFPPHELETNSWLDTTTWIESKIIDCFTCVESKSATKNILVSDKNKGLEFYIKIYKKHKIDILINRRDMIYEDNTCLEWQEKFILMLVQKSIIDVGILFMDDYKSTLFFGKKNLILLKYFSGDRILYKKRNKKIIEFIERNWNNLHAEKEILQIEEKEVKQLYKLALLNSFFSSFPREQIFFEMIYEIYIKKVEKFKLFFR